MKIEKLYPWNWFKHEKPGYSKESLIPFKRPANTQDTVASRVKEYSNPVRTLHHVISRMFNNTLCGGDSSIVHSMQFEIGHGCIQPRLNFLMIQMAMTLHIPRQADDGAQVDSIHLINN